MKTFEFDENDIVVDTTCISDKPDDILYFDIETTGLSASRSDLYLIGLGFYDGDHFKTLFLFNDDGCSEPEILAEFADHISRYKYLVSYNGDTFDIPYVRTKMQQFDIDCSFDNIRSIDIYKTSRKYKKLFNMSSAKQVDVEELVGFQRKIFISGGTLINTYKEYLKTGSNDLLDDLMTHNHDDVRGLISITEFLNLPRICNELETLDVCRTDDSIEYTCGTPKLPCRITYASSVMRINANDRQLRILIPVTNKTMKFFFKDYKNYYYLPMEDMAIHKSMAAYVDSSHKEKATKETAYTQVTDMFIPAPPHEKSEVFYDTGMDGDRFIRLSDELTSIGQVTTQYIQNMLAVIFP